MARTSASPWPASARPQRDHDDDDHDAQPRRRPPPHLRRRPHTRPRRRLGGTSDERRPRRWRRPRRPSADAHHDDHDDVARGSRSPVCRRAPRPALVVKVDNVDAEPQWASTRPTSCSRRSSRAAPHDSPPCSTRWTPTRSVRSAPDDPGRQPAAEPQRPGDRLQRRQRRGVNDALQAAGFELLGEGTPGFFRRDDLPAPHNLYANLCELWPQLVSSGNAVPDLRLRRTGRRCRRHAGDVRRDDGRRLRVRWDWDAAGLFLRSQLGSPHELTDGQASADTVVVLVLDYGTSPAGGGPEAQTLGTGEPSCTAMGSRWKALDPPGTRPTVLPAGQRPADPPRSRTHLGRARRRRRTTSSTAEIPASSGTLDDAAKPLGPHHW